MNLLKRHLKDPDKAEKIYIIFWIGMIVINLALAFGFVMFMWFLWKR